MNFTDQTIWSLIVGLYALAPLVETASIMRVVITRQAPQGFLIAVISLGVSIWSLIVVWNALNMDERVSSFVGLHLSPHLYHLLRAILAQTLFSCQLQTIVALTVFLLILYVERTFLPYVDRPPIWVLVQDHMMLR